MGQEVTANETHTPDTMGGSEEGRHTERSLLILSNGFYLRLKVAINVYCELETLDKKLKLSTVVLQFF